MITFFLSDINNEGPNKNATYKRHLTSLTRFVLILFTEDITVVPRESEWFGVLPWGTLDPSAILAYNQTQLYQEDWIGLKVLDQKGALIFQKCKGAHMQFSLEYLHNEVIVPYLL